MDTVSETTEESTVPAGDAPIEPLLKSSRFLRRLGQMDVVDCAMTKASHSYKRVKKATPSMVRPVVDSAELTVLQVINQITAIVLSLPLPLHFADELACASLDKFENLAQYKQGLIERLHQLTPDRFKSAPLTDEDKSFYFDLLRFVSAVRDLAAGGLKSNLSFFIDIQLALLERVEGVITTLHAAELASSIDKKFDVDFVGRMQKVKLAFEDAIKQQNEIVNWALGGKLHYNPLEPAWKHLQNTAQKLSPNKDVIKALHNKVGLFKDILKGAIEQLKLAAKDSEQALAEVKANIYGRVISIARTWLPEFAISSIQRFSGLALDAVPIESKTVDTISEMDYDKEITGLSSGEKPEDQQMSQCTKKIAKFTAKKSVTIVEPFEMATVEAFGGTENEPKADAKANIEVSAETEITEEDDEEGDENGQDGLEESTEIDNANEPERKRRTRRRRRTRKAAEDQHYHPESAE